MNDKGFWNYMYDYGNYRNGFVINFKTKEEAINHALEHHKDGIEDIDEDIFFLRIGEFEDIYTGE